MSDPADTVRALVAAMAELDCHAVVSTGGLDVPDLAPADNVLVYPWIPQSVLLRCAQLFVTHGGYNSIRESLLTGTPMVVLPQYGDNIANARRVGELGVGVGLSDGPARVEAIVAACRQVLSEPAFTARTRQAQRAMLALPGVGTVVTHLESLASV
ncbi:glycosyltransferase [Kutzneria kofuensis]